MNFGSVCSGIEAASCAWHPLGWKPVFFSEIEPFPCSVLNHHYPETPNLGDMTKFKEWPDAVINVLVGGTPCQSFSVAGLRKGLDDPRGNLMLTFGAIAAKYRPEWLVWENVPGVLSSNGGRDFGTFLGMLGQLGYGFAYRVLDAQYFGVAQRRRRVFVVARFGDWRGPAAVLFERHSLQGDFAPSREAGQGTACNVAPGAADGGENVAAYRMAAFGEYSDDGSASAMKARDYKDATDLVVQPLSAAFSAGNSGNSRSIGYVEEATPPLRSGASGTNQVPTLVTPYVAQPTPYRITFCDANGRRQDRPNGGLYVSRPDVAGTLTSAESDLKIVQPICFHPTQDPISSQDGKAHCMGTGSTQGGATIAVAFAQNSRDEVRLMGGDGSLVGALAAEAGMKQTCYVAQCVTGDITHTPKAEGFDGSEDGTGRGNPIVAQAVPINTQMALRGAETSNTSREGVGVGDLNDPAFTLQAAHHHAVATAMQVRRLTPTECERLQGFPDSYTNVPHRGKPAADGPRYKSLGNSMAVPVMAWIGKRIQLVSEILKEAAA